MATELYMPKMGMDMENGTIIKWLKNVGDKIEKDEPFMEIETDKISMEIESPASGVLLEKLYEDGAVVPVLTVVGYIGEPNEKILELDEEIPESDKEISKIPLLNEVEQLEQILYFVKKSIIGGLTKEDIENIRKKTPEWIQAVERVREHFLNLNQDEKGI